MDRLDKSKTYFLGCPTPDGFSTRITDDISAPEFTTYIIKGGPGTGKSSLMKRIGTALSEYEQPELYYCSSDPNSLDAVVFRKLGVIVIDGTSPHVIEPEYPGVRQILVDLGECWDTEKLAESKDKIVDSTVKNKRYHALARRYLKAVASLKDDIYTIADACINKQKLDGYCTRLCSKLFPKTISAPVRISYRQMTSITPEGVITHSGNFEGLTVYRIDDSFYAVADRIMKRITSAAISKGYDVEVSKSVFLSGEVYEHIVIPQLNIAFVTCDIKSDAKINSMRFYDRNLIKDKRKRLSFDIGIAGNLTSETVAALKTAKVIHDELEGYYISAMDFEKVNSTGDRLIEKITTLIKKNIKKF